MTPGQFDAATCRELLGDQRARIVEASARGHADAADINNPGEAYSPPRIPAGTTYWDGIVAEAERITYYQAFQRRLERMRRKQSTTNLGAPA
jgi:hypothetical protein